MGILGIAGGGVIGGGLAGLVMSSYYGSNLAAAATLGPAYPVYLVGSTVIGGVLGGKYAGKSHAPAH